MPTQNGEDQEWKAILAVLLPTLLLMGLLLALAKPQERHPPSALVLGTVCRGGLFNYCTEDYGCLLTYVGHKILHDHVAEKAVSCISSITHCHQGCCEDGGDTRYCLDGACDALAPLVQPPL